MLSSAGGRATNCHSSASLPVPSPFGGFPEEVAEGGGEREPRGHALAGHVGPPVLVWGLLARPDCHSEATHRQHAGWLLHRHQNNWRFTMTWEAGWRYGIMSTIIYGSLWTAKNIQTNDLIITREAGWRYGIISTIIYGSLWTAKNIQTNNLISENILFSISLTGLPCHREPSIVLMSMVGFKRPNRLLCIPDLRGGIWESTANH